jgi:hypothetical protein
MCVSRRLVRLRPVTIAVLAMMLALLPLPLWCETVGLKRSMYYETERFHFIFGFESKIESRLGG